MQQPLTQCRKFRGNAPSLERASAVYALKKAAQHVQRRGGRTPGTDGLTIPRYLGRGRGELRALRDAVRSGDWSPGPARVVYIPKRDGSQRPIVVLNAADRIIAAALLGELKSSIGVASPSAYGTTRARGLHAALERTARLCRPGAWAIGCDIKDFYASIRRDHVDRCLRDRGVGSPFLEVVLRGLEVPLAGPGGQEVRDGLPQGHPLSPYMADLVLAPTDAVLDEAPAQAIRYADDVLLVDADVESVTIGRTVLAESLAESDLHLNPAKERIVELEADRIEFLGFSFGSGIPRVPDETLGNVACCLDGLRGRRLRDAARGIVDHYSFGGIDALRERLLTRISSPAARTMLAAAIEAHEARSSARTARQMTRVSGIDFGALTPEAYEAIVTSELPVDVAFGELHRRWPNTKIYRNVREQRPRGVPDRGSRRAWFQRGDPTGGDP